MITEDELYDEIIDWYKEVSGFITTLELEHLRYKIYKLLQKEE